MLRIQNLAGNTLQKSKLQLKPSKSIFNPNIISNDTDYRSKLFNVVGSKKANVGFIELNQSHKYNTLNSLTVRELKRFIQSYELDEGIRSIWIQSNDPCKVFSKGTDFKYLVQNQLNNKSSDSYQYLRNLNELGLILGSINKPTLVNANGQALNSSASLILNSPFVLSNSNSIVQFNETHLGFTPTCGASYFLSRMPNQFGVYCFLTGFAINGEEMVKLSISDYFVNDMNMSMDQFILQNQQQQPLLSSVEMYGDMFKESQNTKFKMQSIMNDVYGREIEARIQNGENAKLVLTEVLYKKQKIEAVNNQENISRLGFDQQITNQMNYYKEQVLNPVLVNLTQKEQIQGTSLPLETISRCFSGFNLQQIYDNLQKENTPWSLNILQTLKSKSQLSLHLSLKLIRDAESSQWQECYEREFRVAVRRLNDEDFQVRVKNISNNQQIQEEQNIFSDDQINQYFQPLMDDLKINELSHDILQNSLYPVKEFYESYADSVRYYLNERNIKNTEERDGQEFDVESFLFKNNIDPRNLSLKTSVVREYIYKLDFQRKKFRMYLQKLRELCQSQQNLNQFYEQRQSYLDQIFEKEWQMIVDQNVQKIFEKYFDERIKKIENLSKNCQYQEKKFFFQKLKKLILKSRLIRNTTPKLDQFDENQDQILESISRPLFFPSSNADSFVNQKNQQLIDKLQNDKTINKYELFEDQDKTQKEVDERFQLKYGISKREKEFQNDHLKKLNDFCASYNQNILSELPDVSQETKVENLHNELRAYAQLQLNNQQIDFDISLEALQSEIIAVKSLYDLQPNIKESPKNNSNLDLFKEFLQLDKGLQNKMQPLFTEQSNKAVEQIRQKFNKLFGDVMQSVFNDKHFFQLTQDGKTEFVGEQNMRVFDNFIKKNMLFESISFQEGPLLYRFGYLGLVEIEEYYQKLSQASQQMKYINQQGGDSTMIQMLTFLKKNNIEMKSSDDFEPVTQYLNQISQLCTQLFIENRNKLQNKQDILLGMYTDSVRINGVGRDKKSPIQYLIEKFEEKHLIQTNLNEQLLKKYKGELQENPIEEVTQRSKRRNRVQQQPESERFYKKLVVGVFQDLKKLDQYEQRAIDGVDNFIPEELKQYGQDYFYEYLKDYNLTQTASQWFQNKLFEYMEKLFNVRYQIEQNVSQSSLVTFDHELLQYLQKDSLKSTLQEILQKDLQTLKSFGESFKSEQMNQKNLETQESKSRNELLPHSITGNIKNPQAYDKYVTFSVNFYNKYNIEKQDPVENDINIDIDILDSLFKEVQQNPKKQNQNDIQSLYREVLNKESIQAIDSTHSYQTAKLDARSYALQSLKQILRNEHNNPSFKDSAHLQTEIQQFLKASQQS